MLLPGPEIAFGDTGIVPVGVKLGMLKKGIQDDPRAQCLIGQPVSSDLGDLLDYWRTQVKLMGGALV